MAAGVDVVQVDEPYIQARADKAREFAAEAINRALEGVTVPTVLHTCFGYGAKVLNKTEDRYPYFAEFAATNADQISIEAAQPKLDLRQLDDLPSKTIMLGVLDLADPQVETPEVVAARIRAALQHLPPERLVIAPDCGMKYLPREVDFAKLCAMVAGAQQIGRAHV